MKNTGRFLIAAAALVLFTSAGQTRAQSQPSAHDGIAASPKLRQQLNEREAAARVLPMTSSATVTYNNPAEGVTASPKVLQRLAEQRVVISGAQTTEVASTGYQPTGSDGIAASPKVRQQLNERPQMIEIAPLK